MTQPLPGAVLAGLDWGTTSLRAYAFDATGAIIGSLQSADGIQQRQGAFAETLEDVLDRLGVGKQVPALLSGMIGSRQGWVEAPYIELPASLDSLAGALQPVPGTRRVAIVPGACRSTERVPEVMRGEETQLFGLLDRDATGLSTVAMPGTHCKWVLLDGAEVRDFRTYMTGEVFGLMSERSILSRLMQPGDDDWAAFEQGLARAREPGGLLNHLFGTRTLGLFERLPATGLRSYLSGLLIGHEIVSAEPRGKVVLVGDGDLTERYRRALAWSGIEAVEAPEDIAAKGLFRIARAANMVAS